MSKKPLPTDFEVLLGMATVLVVPWALTLRKINQSRPLVVGLAANPCPHGCSWSLSLFILLLSLCWEATLAVPYQWRGYQPS